MNYVRQVTDLDTGKKTWLDLGDHRPLSEVAKDLGVGPRRLRDALAHMGMLSREWDDRSQQHRFRLTPGAVASGLGIRHDNKGFQYDPDRTPFDVLSPVGIEYVRDHLPATLTALSELPEDARAALTALGAFAARQNTGMTPEMRVCWLTCRYPDMGPSQIAQGLGISETLVHRYRARRGRQIRDAEMAAAFAPAWRPPSEGPTEAQLAEVVTAGAMAAKYHLGGVEP
ncbi:hypothetical protein [uncultured Reyranella sp.]|uniref:hypothetical protein n=1 Tax=uncultured Reyranella sp. TaxID=735512 RepID=UPI0025FEEE68|nr:hypothetical protein [uncultured Reyranella sp.]